MQQWSSLINENQQALVDLELFEGTMKLEINSFLSLTINAFVGSLG